MAAGISAASLGAIVLSVHCVVILLGVRLLNMASAGISLQMLLLASNANIGGSGTAMAMATAMNWPHLLTASATCGTLGYSIATLLGVAMQKMLLRFAFA